MVARVLQWRFTLLQFSLLLLLSNAMTWWSMLVFGGLLIAKSLQLYRQEKAWSERQLNLVALGFVGALLLFARSLGVVNLMFHLLLLAAMLRLLSLPSSKTADWQQLLWVHYFLLACAFILHQEIWLALSIFAVGLLNLSCHHLYFANRLQRIHWGRLVRVSTMTLVVTSSLFVLFPRLPPLWQLPGNNLAKTGLADEVAPGDIASLLQSDALAFRVAFDGPAPTFADLYFRAKVYDSFDGTRWQAERAKAANATTIAAVGQQSTAATAPLWQYSVVVEPHQQRHLFSLGLPVQLSDKTQLTQTLLLQSRQPVSQRVSYQLSAIDTPLPAEADQRRYLQLPPGNPQSRQLAARLRERTATTAPAQSARLIVQQISEYLQAGGFSYTLTPGVMSNEQIDTFLFSRKTGFCAHYAQAAVFLLRASNVPARLVGGYLGGQWQDDGAYLQVRQSDAHAWVEYFAQGHWHRYDPTALIEPALFSRSQASTQFTAGAANVAALWGRLQLLWSEPLQHLDYYWSAWVLSFDHSSQRKTWQQFKDWRWSINWTLLAPLAAILVLLLLWRLLAWRKASHNLLTPLYQRYPKVPSQTVSQYLQALQQRYPAQQQEIAALLLLYQRWQFNDEKQLTASLAQQIRQLSRALK